MLDAAAERIPLPDASVDAVVGTVVLCSVADPAQVLAEVRRVLRPGGVYVFFEHVAAAPGSRLRRVQSLWAPVARRFDAGCDPTWETWRTTEAAGFARVDMSWYAPRLRWDIAGRYIAGHAVA